MIEFIIGAILGTWTFVTFIATVYYLTHPERNFEKRPPKPECWKTD